VSCMARYVPYAGSWEKIGAIWLSYNWLKKGDQVQVPILRRVCSILFDRHNCVTMALHSGCPEI
jgi:hypothetical protein